MPNTFTTKNLIFRPLNLDDKYDIYRLFSDPKVVQLDQSEPVKSIQEVEELIRIAERSQYDPHSINWGAELKETGRVIGTCGFKNWDRLSNHAEIGGNLSSELWGKGYAAEGLIAILDYAFNKMFLNKICAYTNSRNGNAIGIMRKYGFQQEGKLREHQFLDGEYVDVLAYSLLKKEYEVMKKSQD
ncbi:ribosomal-protein-alanine N-acetyltransferase [Evansella vedderi]|uniref:Ribosomal-protein-alanine N-acetyltransferase n=1 Tax=Evansella vedderi TaxID=38282 RepID=A0ABT9ZYE8_9BACI|nr:GNAT family protein [Evansella vedderi]MDQ0255716.1 ribosomal-protein-alanine N-acetyltransferase [Evansella vedderi]